MINFNNNTDILRKKQFNNIKKFDTSPFANKNILLNLSSNNNNNINKKEKTDCFSSLYQNKTKIPNYKNRKNDLDYNRNFFNTNTNTVFNNNFLSNKIKSHRDFSNFNKKKNL